jgi:ribonuclease-3
MFEELSARLGITFKDANLLRQALTHRSYLNEHPQLKLAHNERLEFLGDAVLELIVTDYLYRHYPAQAEGELTMYRAALVNADTLGLLAEKLGLNDYLQLSKGEKKDTGRGRLMILANAMEALIGAIYLDSGYEAALQLVSRELLPQLPKILEERLWQDAKSKLQEEAQSRDGQTPDYRLLDEAGPDHNKTFTIGLFIGERLVATGSGSSKQRAEQEAARQALLIYAA